MGRAIEYLPYIIYAVSQMAERGLGVDRASFELTEAKIIRETGKAEVIYSGGLQRLTTPELPAKSLSELIQARLQQLTDLKSIKLNFLTPTRIRVEGDLQFSLSFELLVRNLLRRISLLAA